MSQIWDEELETITQRWADHNHQCIDDYDVYRNTGE